MRKPTTASVIDSDVSRLAAHGLCARLDARLEPEEVGQAGDDRVTRGRVVALERTDDHRAAKPRDSSLGGHVGEGTLDALEVVVELAECGVALEAEQPAHVAGLVVVIDVERLPRLRRPPTHRAPAPLLREPPLVVLRRDPVLALQVRPARITAG